MNFIRAAVTCADTHFGFWWHAEALRGKLSEKEPIEIERISQTNNN
jgi:hypothetical protein